MIKRRKSAAALLLCGILSLGMSAGSLPTAAQTEEETDNTTERRAEIMIVSIIGNELTYYEIETETDETEESDEENSEEENQNAETFVEEETEMIDSTAQETGSDAEEEEDDRTPPQMGDSSESGGGPRRNDSSESGNDSQMNAGGSGGGPQMKDSTAGNDSDRSDSSNGDSSQGDFGGMPDFEGGSMPQGEMPNPGSSEESGESESSERSDRKMGQGFFTQSYTTVYLQVGVPVHTDQEEDSTFTILQDGDQVEVLFVTDEESGEEVITEIWME